MLPPLGRRDDAAEDAGCARLPEALLPPGSAGSCADVDSQTQELSPTALAGEVLGSLARGGGDGRAAQRPPPRAALSPSGVRPVPPGLSGAPRRQHPPACPAPCSPSQHSLSRACEGRLLVPPPAPPPSLRLEAPGASTQDHPEAPGASTPEALGKCSRVTHSAWLGVLSLPCWIWAARPHLCHQGAQTHPPQKAPRPGAHSRLARPSG